MVKRPYFIDLIAAVCFVVTLARGAETKPFGIQKRELWTISRVIGSPDPPLPYTTESAFSKLHFDHPVDLASASASERLFVAEHQSGHMFSFRNESGVERAELFLNLHEEGREIWSMARRRSVRRGGRERIVRAGRSKRAG